MCRDVRTRGCALTVWGRGCAYQLCRGVRVRKGAVKEGGDVRGRKGAAKVRGGNGCAGGTGARGERVCGCARVRLRCAGDKEGDVRTRGCAGMCVPVGALTVWGNGCAGAQGCGQGTRGNRCAGGTGARGISGVGVRGCAGDKRGGGVYPWVCGGVCINCVGVGVNCVVGVRRGTGAQGIRRAGVRGG